MANICNTTYVLTGDNTQLKAAYKDINRLCKAHPQPCLNLFFRDIDPGNNEWIINLSKRKVNGKAAIQIETESKWCREESTPFSFEELYPGTTAWYITEEPGNGIFETNDKCKTIFPQQVIVDTDYEGMEYLTEEQAIMKLCAIFGRPDTNTTIESLREEAQERNKAIEAGDMEGARIWVHIADAA